MRFTSPIFGTLFSIRLSTKPRDKRYSASQKCDSFFLYLLYSTGINADTPYQTSVKTTLEVSICYQSPYKLFSSRLSLAFVNKTNAECVGKHICRNPQTEGLNY